ncbi:LysR substrate-binding domain-containing protein [Variovorax sp. ZS18.2.2]|uniref:LysR substrate-binding domain-containing protein n=1 Tax=Variovorax sp. ZS18.2.2 TaxID=2971255 RepID=UPI002150CD0D|nr:LysR substrate-binding domain-containing protein [Variovorax sp. ZS18.2.2]MCR6474816.1 LysR substrate-binding domain-containing protein [Variovorax sp. ZS18.2.2]
MNSPHASTPRRLPPLNMLRAFEAAGRLGSVTRAAQELHVTQSAVSHQIKALEEWLDAALVARDGRRLALTPQGAAYLPSLSNALDVMAHATARIERQATRHTLSVNALPTLASQWLIPQLSRFRELMPDIDVQLATTTSVLDFEPGAYDVVLRCLSPAELAALQARPGWRDVRFGRFLPDAVMTPMCSPDWLARGPALKKPADLRHHTLLHSRSTPTAWRDWLAQAGAGKLEPAGALVFDHAHLAVQAAVQGLGIALGNPTLLRDMLDSRLLVAPFAAITMRENDFFWIFPPRSQDNAAAHAFCRWLEACA